MMQAWAPLGLVVLAGAGLLILVSRLQSASYRGYLDRQIAETAKMVESQRLTQQAVDRQTAALERIATALEQRQS
jgi:hypothetical protein